MGVAGPRPDQPWHCHLCSRPRWYRHGPRSPDHHRGSASIHFRGLLAKSEGLTTRTGVTYLLPMSRAQSVASDRAVFIFNSRLLSGFPLPSAWRPIPAIAVELAPDLAPSAFAWQVDCAVGLAQGFVLCAFSENAGCTRHIHRHRASSQGVHRYDRGCTGRL
jgi:hypothetical protein